MSERPRRSIGIVCFPAMGGSGVVASELASGLSARGHRVHLFSTAPPGREGTLDQAVRFHRITTAEYPLFESAPYTLAVASQLIDAARAEPLDLIDLHYAVPHAVCGLLVRQVLGGRAPRLVASLHGTDVTRVGADLAYRTITAAAIAAADGVVVPSAFLREQAYQSLGLPTQTQIEVLPNFVDTERFAPPPERDRAVLHALFEGEKEAGPVLFHVSNFRPIKRTPDLLEVLARVRRSLPARLVVVGDGPERPLVEARARELGLSGAVRFLGKQTDFARWLRHADAFVFPSETESFGLAALEALACGVPVFAYRVGGLPEVVDADAGRLVAPLEVGALADAVLEVLVSPALREKMGEAARRSAVERFRREPALDHYEAFFERVLAAGRR